MILVLRRACPDAPDGHVGCRSCSAFASGGSPKGVSRGAGGSCMVDSRADRAVPLHREVPSMACPEAQEGRAGCRSSWSCCAFASGGSLKGVSRGAVGSCWLPVELYLCVRRFSEGRVPRRRRVVLAACRAGRAVPLRREVPRRACPEAQEGRAWLPVELLVLCLC